MVIVLVYVEGILQKHRALDHEVGTVLTDTTVHNNSVDLHGVRLLVLRRATSLALLTLE